MREPWPEPNLGLDRFGGGGSAVPGIAKAVNIDHIKRGYYSMKALNPNGIVPVGPDLPFAPLLHRGA